MPPLTHRLRLWPIVAAIACGACAGDAVTDPIDGFPAAQQRAVARPQFGLDWPFETAAGTLACRDGAVAFRANGETYALNDAAANLGFRAVGGVVRIQRGGPPSHPLSRVRQDERQRIFRVSMLCERSSTGDLVTRCKTELRDSSGVTSAELDQIEAEGRERLWPPLPERRVSLEPLVKAGLKLCER
jgi:hypothetical protein